ncbi:MAG: SBBP repeat-containing protein [Ignavibacteria bacterium]|nr:SBBP repeat-containing protein [Ignavibacteria bacterium]
MFAKKSKTSIFIVFIVTIELLFAFKSSNIYAQVWTKRYAGLNANSYDYVHDMKVDNYGNVYVTGWSGGDMFLVKSHYSNGFVEWVARYNGQFGNDISNSVALDASGNPYIAGQVWNGSNYDFVIVRYNSLNGVQTWATGYSGLTSTSDDRGLYIDIDKSAGKVWAAGVSNEYEGIEWGPFIRRINTDGTDVLNYNFSSKGEFNVIKVDPSTHWVYAAGYKYRGNNKDWYIVAIDESSNIQWSYFYEGAANLDDYATDLVVDPFGNSIIVTGTSDGQSKFTTIKISNMGFFQWANNDVSGIGRSIAVFNNGSNYDIIVTGVTFENGSSQYATIKYDQNGTQIWKSNYHYLIEEQAYSIAVDGSGNSFVTGYSKNYGFDQLDIVTVRYNNSGQQTALFRYDGPAHSTDIAKTVVLDAAGRPHVGGYSLGLGTYFDGVYMKYQPGTAKGCPWLYTFNEETGEFIADNNILHRSEFTENYGLDIKDMYKLNVTPSPFQGNLYFRIFELDNDYNYIDNVKLWQIDHTVGTEIGVDENGLICKYTPLNISDPGDVKQTGVNSNVARYVSYDTMANKFIFGQPQDTVSATDFEYAGSGTGDSLAILINAGQDLSDQIQPAPKISAGTIITYANDSPIPTSRSFARRENNSDIIIPFASANSSIDSVVIQWERSYQVDYLTVVEVSYSGFVVSELDLVDAIKSDTNSVMKNLESIDQNYAEFDSTTGIYLQFESDGEPQSGYIRDFVFETNGRYELNGGDHFSRLLQNNQTQNAFPKKFVLEQNFPNPFNPITNIRYEVPVRCHVKIEVYDINGRLVSILLDEVRNLGVYTIPFDGTKLSSGVYFYRLVAGNFVQSKKMVLLK